MSEITLEWIPVDDAAAYRLTFRETGSGDLVTRTDPFTEPRYALDPELLDGRDVYARLEVRVDEGDDEEGWEDAGPTAPIPMPDPDADVTVLSWEGVSPVHRLVISDQTNGEKVIDQPVLGTSFPYSPGGAEQGHDLVWRVRAWRDDDWDEGTGWQMLPLRVMLGEEREPPPPLASDRDAGLLLVFSIDTEGFLARQKDPNPATAVDELIFGDFPENKGGGIGLHMDLLEHFGYRGSFFVDVLSAYQYGEDQLKRAVDAILSRGHEVQLHVHDEHLRNADDPAIRALAGDLMAKDRGQFQDILGLGIEVFERLAGHRPIAYRAGGYRITDDHFPALQELGIRIDTSVNAYLNSRVSEWMKTRTQPYWVDDILELPPTWTLVRDHREAQETRAFAPNATAGDPVSSLPSSPTGIPRIATYVSHSSELMISERGLDGDERKAWESHARERLKEEIADKAIQEVTANARLVNGVVNDELVYRMAGLLRRISDRDDARCVTFAELSEVTDRFPRERRREPVDPVPAIDRPHGEITVTGTRIYSDAFLADLADSERGGRRAAESSDDEVTTLVNADVGWKGTEVAVIGPDSPEVGEWLERRGIASVEQFDGPDPKAGKLRRGRLARRLRALRAGRARRAPRGRRRDARRRRDPGPPRSHPRGVTARRGQRRSSPLRARLPGGGGAIGRRHRLGRHHLRVLVRVARFPRRGGTPGRAQRRRAEGAGPFRRQAGGDSQRGAPDRRRRLHAQAGGRARGRGRGHGRGGRGRGLDLGRRPALPLRGGRGR